MDFHDSVVDGQCIARAQWAGAGGGGEGDTHTVWSYGVATIIMLLKMIGLFCKKAL